MEYCIVQHCMIMMLYGLNIDHVTTGCTLKCVWYVNVHLIQQLVRSSTFVLQCEKRTLLINCEHQICEESN